MFGWWKKRQTKAKPVAQEKKLSDEPAPLRHKYSVGVHTDVGCVRSSNEDNARCVGLNDKTAATRGVLIIVADGMGGHASGEVASEIAVETVCREYFASGAEPENSLRAALETANRAIYDAARKDGSKKGMGTTCTSLVLLSGSAVSAHVGDSRLYLVRGGGIYLMSEDHSAVMELVRQGLLTAAEARHHENKNLITRALGLHPSVEVSTWNEPFPLRDDDRFLLCSDGLYDLVEDDEILQGVLSNLPQQACIELINLAKQRGGHDNISVAVVHVEPSKAAATPPGEEPALAESAALTLPETREAEAIQ